MTSLPTLAASADTKPLTVRVGSIKHTYVAIRYKQPLDRTFHALGDDTRRRMLSMVCQRGACSAGQFVDAFDSAQPTISKHLRVLEKAGLLQRHVHGRRHTFTLVKAELQRANSWLGRHLSLWENSLDQLGAFLDANAAEGGGK